MFLENTHPVNARMEVSEALPEGCRPPSWKAGFSNEKPTSIVQSLFLTQISHLNRSSYTMCCHIFRQLHRSRAQHKSNGTEEEEGNSCITENTLVPEFPGLLKNSKGEVKSQHISLSVTSQSGPFLRVSEERILWRDGGRSSKRIAFCQMEPDLDRTFRTKFKIETENSGKFGEDWDVYYPDLNGSEDAVFLKEIHPKVLVIPRGGKRMYVYNNENGKFIEELDFGETSVYQKVTCHENGNIIVESKHSKLPKGVLYEFLIIKHPPFRVDARVQILASACADKKYSPTRFEIVADFLIGFCPSNTIQVYDLEVAMQENVFSGRSLGTLRVSHLLRNLPKPLLSVKSINSYLAFYNYLPSYFITKEEIGFEVHEITPSGIEKIDDNSIKKDKMFASTSAVSFMADAPPRIICKGQTSLRIFQICRGGEEDSCDSSSSYLRLVFFKDFARKLGSFYDDDRQGLRNKSRVSYSDDENLTLLYDENIYLQQLAVIRFAEKCFKVYVYDSFNFDLQYKILIRHFSPRDSEIYDEINVYFTPSFIAVWRKGSASTTIYLVALARGLT